MHAQILVFLSTHSVSIAWLVFMLCQQSFLCWSVPYVIKNQEMGFTKAQSLGLFNYQILAGNDYHMFGTTTKLSMLFQVLGCGYT